MCLGIPAKIISIEGDFARANINGAQIDVGIQLIANIEVGDYVLVHTGYALEKLSEEEAQKTLQAIKDLEDLNNLDLPTSL